MKYKLILWALVLAAFMALYFWSTGQHTKGYAEGYAKRSEETLEAMKSWENLQQARANFVKKTVEDLTQEYQRKNRDFEQVKKNADQELNNLLLTVDMQRAHILHLHQERDSNTSSSQASYSSPPRPDDRTGLENVARECASTLVQVATDAERLRTQVIGLQQFANLAEASCQ